MFELSAPKHRTYCGCSSRPRVNVTPTPIPFLLCLTAQSLLSREYSHTASYLLHLLPSPPVSLPSCAPPHTDTSAHPFILLPDTQQASLRPQANICCSSHQIPVFQRRIVQCLLIICLRRALCLQAGSLSPGGQLLGPELHVDLQSRTFRTGFIFTV